MAAQSALSGERVCYTILCDPRYHRGLYVDEKRDERGRDDVEMLREEGRGANVARTSPAQSGYE
jgi:hypothetical protein